MRFSIIFLCLVLVIVLFIFFRQYKKNEFNSIEIGDEIFYPQETFYDECYNILESDTVINVEYYEDGENIKYIYTEKGKKYNFLDYIRDNFIISN